MCADVIVVFRLYVATVLEVINVRVCITERHGLVRFRDSDRVFRVRLG